VGLVPVGLDLVGDMADLEGALSEIELHKGKGKTLVDDEDFEYLSQWKWYLDSYGYAVRLVGRRPMGMHRQLMGCPVGLEVDHINRDRLDNRKVNLRAVTRAVNARNNWGQIRPNNTSGFPGVIKRYRRWAAQAKFDNRNVYLGSFASKEEAYEAYKRFKLSLPGAVPE
jgi:hypothetical protein